ncbi:PAAR domain-containing protein [Serratia marcescens]|uniref:PAAR domain-containing protein n=1 Tax=Serratia marcescens TaxID=615 RepID=UPI0021C2BEEE|nr:PAAR domain-containing protein [Serratia marcescens]
MSGKRFKIITVGDQTTTGGRVLNGARTVFCQNKAVAFIGSISFCPQCKTSGVIRRTQPFNVFAEDRPVCIEGDIVECRCPVGVNRLIASSGAFEFIGYDDGCVGYSISSADSEGELLSLYDEQRQSASANESKTDYMIQFHCMNDDGSAMAHHHYTLLFADGFTETGITNEFGDTGWYSHESAQIVTINMGMH